MPTRSGAVRHWWRSALTACPHQLIIPHTPSRLFHSSGTRSTLSCTATPTPSVSPSALFPPSPLPLHLPSSHLSSVFTPAHAHRLSRYGFTVIDGAFGDAFCFALQRDALFLHQHQLMIDNHTHLVTHGGQRTHLLPKRGIHEADTHTPGLDPLIPACSALTQDRTLLRSIASALPTLGLESQSAKVQVNAGDGACFPLHFDAYHAAAGSDHRHVTAILYLNEGYNASHGGQLQLFPIPYAPVTIEPRWDRLVVFTSASLLHRVLPSSHQRLCITLWMSGQPLPSRPFPPPLPTGTLSTALLSALSSLLHPRLYPHYCKLLLRELWARSIEESHGAGEATEAAVAQHWRDVEVIEQALQRWVREVPEGLVGVDVGREAEGGLRVMAGVRWATDGKAEEKKEELLRQRPPLDWEALHRFV